MSRFHDFVILRDNKETKGKTVAESQQAVQVAGRGTASCGGGILG